jgi:hypothetical protein
MIYWLLIFSFNADGEFVSKQELHMNNKFVCELVSAQYPAQVKIGFVKTLCVSDDHHSGRKQDEGVEYD